MAIAKVRLIICALFLGVVCGCYDKAYPPFVQNGLDVPVNVRISFTDGFVREDTWDPGSRGPIGRENANVTEVVIFSGGRELHLLDLKTLTEMRSSVKDERRVTWRIERDGVRPLRNEYLQKSQNK